MTFDKKIILSFCLVFVFFFLIISPVYAIPSGLPFGGLVNFTLPCTCTGSLYIWFTPLYFGPTPVTGSLVFTPFASVLYENYLIGVPSMWHLGDYKPGIQACFIITPVGCIPIPSAGVIGQVGTSVY